MGRSVTRLPDRPMLPATTLLSGSEKGVGEAVEQLAPMVAAQLVKTRGICLYWVKEMRAIQGAASVGAPRVN